MNCNPGYYELNGVCETCPVGNYQPNEGQTSCVSCPSGYTTTHEGEIESSACVQGKMNTKW